MPTRCSSLPLLFRCPGAAVTSDAVLVSPYCESAETGTDVHRALARYPEGNAPEHILAEMDDETRILYFTGAKMWRERLSKWMPDSDSEVPLATDDLTGHLDRLGVYKNETEAVILDWKTGRVDIDNSQQFHGYAHLVFDAYPKMRQVTTYGAWVRTQEIEPYTVDRARTEAWKLEFDERVAKWDGVFHPGTHCQGCPRQVECPALRVLARQASEIVQSEPADLSSMPGPQLVGLHRKLRTWKRLLALAEDSIEAEVRARGDVPDGEGRVLHYVKANAPRKLDTLKAWPALSAALTTEELAGCVTVSVGAVESTVAAKAAKGKGAAAKREIVAALDAAGAVLKGTIERLTDERERKV